MSDTENKNDDDQPIQLVKYCYCVAISFACLTNPLNFLQQSTSHAFREVLFKLILTLDLDFSIVSPYLIYISQT